MPCTLLTMVCVPCPCYKVTQTVICIDMLIDKSCAPLAFDRTHGKMVQSDYVTQITCLIAITDNTQPGLKYMTVKLTQYM